MTVYFLFECYYNGNDTWDTVIAAYKDETEAELAAVQKEKEHGSEFYSYYVTSMEVQ